MLGIISKSKSGDHREEETTEYTSREARIWERRIYGVPALAGCGHRTGWFQHRKVRSFCDLLH